MKARILIILMGLFLQIGLQAQITAIPDSNFEQALIDLGIDDVLDGGVLTASVENITYLDVNNRNISDLTGIEAFISLRSLFASNNYLETINISMMPELEILNAMVNEISSIDLSQNTSLKNLLFNNNELTNIDVTHNQQLESIVIGANHLSDIDVSNNQLLKDLFLMENQQITSIDVTSNPLLERLLLRNCGINQIDLSENLHLKHLEVDNTQILNLDLTSNTNLEILSIQGTQIETIDLTSNSMIKVFSFSDTPVASFDFSVLPNLEQVFFTRSGIVQIDLSSNQHIWEVYGVDTPLASLNVKNGMNHLITNFYISSNPNLSCIQVDDAAWSTANWTNIDPQMSFSEDCSGGVYTMIPDSNFEQALIDLGIDDVLDGRVLTTNVETVTSLQIDNKGIADLTGIDAFTFLEELRATGNPLGRVNFSMNQKLNNLELNNCQLTELDVSNNSLLRILQCDNNQLVDLDVSANLLLEGLNAYSNQLVQIDLSKNTLLKGVLLQGNQFSDLDFSSNPMLINVTVHYNPNLSSLNLKNGNNQILTDSYFTAVHCPNLTCIQVDDAVWSTANWTQVDPQTSFSENCGSSGADSDGDGIPDDFDDYPQDETRAFDNYFPASGYGSLAFEDLWPGKGDYDFNDVVVDYRFQAVTNAANEVVKVFARFVLKASGASLRNGFGFNLPNASQNLIAHLENVNVSGYHVTEPFVDLMENGMEAQQSKPTFIVFDDFFNVMEHPGMGLGINTELNSSFVEFEPMTLEITPEGAAFQLSDFSFETWNPFIIVNHERGKEIHLADHRPTDLADLSIFGSYEDASDPATGKFYKTANNLPWAINIVQEFVWPLEKISIVEAYNHFFEWASSSGSEYNNWYENAQGYRNQDKLYIRE